jgi:uncharacterized membrane protein YbhN (UPF0104 family)
MKRKTAITVLQLIIFAALGGGIVWYMLAHMTPADREIMLSSIRQTNLLWLLPFLFFYLLSHWARARRWMLMLDPIGIHPTTANTVFAVLVGYLVNLIPPRAGEVAKCTILARYEKMPADKMIGTIVAERAFDVVCLLILISFAFFWQGDAISHALLGLKSSGNTAQAGELQDHALTMTEILIRVGILAAFIVLLIFIYKRYKYSKVGRFIGGLGKGFASLFHLRKRGMFLVYTCLIWGAYLAQILFGFLAMPATAHLGGGAMLLTLLFGSIAIIVAPGGIGLYPFLIGILLHFGYGLTMPGANAFGWLSWMALTVATLISGVASLILLPLYNREPHDAQAPVDPEPHS